VSLPVFLWNGSSNFAPLDLVTIERFRSKISFAFRYKKLGVSPSMTKRRKVGKSSGSASFLTSSQPAIILKAESKSSIYFGISFYFAT
jgi:hypothetical protein